MKIGIDSFTIRELKLDPYGIIDFAQQHGFEGVQFDSLEEVSPELDERKLQDVKQYGDARGIVTTMSINNCNPITAGVDEAVHRSVLEKQIRACASAGWHELRSYIIASDERYVHQLPWSEHVERSAAFITSLRPVLESCGSRINLENHGDTTFELLAIVEQVGSDICGICLDTANTLVNAEDPVMAAKRVAPYIRMTHIKDAIISFTDRGVRRQGKAPGQGNVDFATILPILEAHNPELMLAIEDHKWLFDIPIFEEEWMRKNPDITALELSSFAKLAVDTERRLAAGNLMQIEEYEAIPYREQMEERLTQGRDYIRSLIQGGAE
ncbi:sugar phosphate isomerase/epimerase family protein [Paenibacillus agaridevorans]|uniref:sugar phosphate isomerase/epimerase family protein n=1 Tax=Paenibacillus agaridevorans TaxID=171404 RepID=UPI001BE4A5CF|nr:sugar phosphate isomerase/epimerase [Paenibacillus agaridevorans]